MWLLDKIIPQVYAQDTDSVFGTINKPPGVDQFSAPAGATGGAADIGLILFASNMIKILTVVAGLWVMLNFVLAGFDYVTSNGDTKVNSQVKDKLTQSVIGLVLIVMSYTIVGIIGLLIFGDATYILNPQISTPD